MTEAGVGPQQHEEVRVAGDGHPEVRLGASGPALGERVAVAADDAVADRRVGDLKAGAEDDRVDAVLDAARVEDSVGGDLGGSRR